MPIVLYTEYHRIKKLIKNEFIPEYNKYNIEFELVTGNVFAGDTGPSSIFTFNWDGEHFDLHIRTESDVPPECKINNYHLLMFWCCDDDKTVSDAYYVINNLHVILRTYENKIIDIHCSPKITNKESFNSFISKLYQYIDTHMRIPFTIDIRLANQPYEQNQFNFLLN